MAEDRFDAVVVGAGPAGAIAAYSLARGGLTVALVDRVQFPRDKACGDLLSPAVGKQLSELGIEIERLPVGDMALVGPNGSSTPLPWPREGALAGGAQALPRALFDEQLRVAALNAGAEFIHADIDSVQPIEDARTSVVRRDGRKIVASFVVGADGSLSRVAETAQLVTQREALWGFAMRYYVEAYVERPLIVYWDPGSWRAFPGYGWVFPNSNGVVNLGLGVSTGNARAGADLVTRAIPAFVEHLRELDLVGDVILKTEHRKGGWLKMGATGTSYGRDSILLAGDAAGLVNPLAGEGISGAVMSGNAAARAILESPASAVVEYRRVLRNRYLDFYPATAALQSFMSQHPRVLSMTGRILTAPVFREPLSSGWSLYFNDLVDGTPSAARTVARSIGVLARAVTVGSRVRRATSERLVG